MKKIVIFTILFYLIFSPISVYARSGCCSHHGGVKGCYGERQLCNDGTLSPTCSCESKYIDYKKTSYYSSNNSYSNNISKNTTDNDEESSDIGYIIVGGIIVLSLFGAKK